MIIKLQNKILTIQDAPIEDDAFRYATKWNEKIKILFTDDRYKVNKDGRCSGC